jgi:hypothetical protein
MGCGLLLSALQNGAGDVARLRHTRPVDLRLFRLVTGRRTRCPTPFQNVGAHTLGLIRFDGAGVRLFLGHANFDQSIENCFALDLQFTR